MTIHTSPSVSGLDPQLEKPLTKKELGLYVKTYLGIDVPSRSLCEDHHSPMDYLWYSFSEQRATKAQRHKACPEPFDSAQGKLRRREKNKNNLVPSCLRGYPPSGDCIVWANRGGGKTLIAAIVTLLDSLFKPGCETRILGGSGEQARRMYEYLAHFINRGFDRHLEGPLLKSRCLFKNGSRVEVLTQSPTSVRGQHVQKLRCDELELFDADVFNAAHFTTHSTDEIRASMELLSTMHRPYGLMQKVVRRAKEHGTPVFKWCLWEVIEKCRGRSCSQCPLSSDCRGKAKRASGHLRIDDVIAQMRRSSRAGWEAEMLCLKPSLENIVFAEFKESEHVADIRYDPQLPLYRSIDFGYVNPFVCLWLQTDSAGGVRVIDEYVRTRATVSENAHQVRVMTPCPAERVAATFCDPAGGARNSITGTSEIRELRACGIAARGRTTRILDGVEQIRRALRAGDGKSGFRVSPKCVRLIEALQCYHYPEDPTVPNETPFKDGIFDHPIDALRYFFVNYNRKSEIGNRKY
ncbi:MAG: hypothetical protein A2Z25_00360 [Planctomycetes bacterium RBG_16_55_9]|nr:MAG: hypothetical protein A2Z25_00360 [Planctomycetes bacterium RBG_16_55_9]